VEEYLDVAEGKVWEENRLKCDEVDDADDKFEEVRSRVIVGWAGADGMTELGR